MPKKSAKSGKKKSGSAASDSKKRAAGHTEIPQGKAPSGRGKLPATDINAQIDALEFEDPYGDDYEEEEAEEEGNEELQDVDEGGEVVNKKMSAVEDSNTTVKKEAWRPGIDKLENGEQLEYDPRAYTMYHSFQTEWPCLSFDILNDTLGDNRQRVRHFAISSALPFRWLTKSIFNATILCVTDPVLTMINTRLFCASSFHTQFSWPLVRKRIDQRITR